MTLFLRRLVLALFLALPLGPVLAADPGPTPPPPATTTDELGRLLDTLEDDARREAFVRDLRALINAQRGIEDQAEQPVGAVLLEVLSDQVDSISQEFVKAAAALIDLPNLFRWLQEGLSSPETRTLWLSILAKIAAIMTAGFVAERVVAFVLRRPQQSIEAQPVRNAGINIAFALLRGFFELLAILAFAATAYGVMTLVAPPYQGRVIVLAVVNAIVVSRVVIVLTRMVLAPNAEARRLLLIGDETANYTFLWIRRLTYLVVYGYFLANAARALGLPPDAHVMLVKLLGLGLLLLLIMLVLQNRHDLAQHLRSDARNGFGRLFRSIADIWHVIVIAYLVALYGVWVIGLPGGFEFILRATVLSVVILVIARGLAELLLRAIRKGFSLSDEQRARFPGLEARANRYLPVLKTTIRTILYGAALLAILQVWGIGVVDWLTGPIGGAIAARVISIAIVILIALVVWEVASAAIERYLTATDTQGNAVQRSQRAKTLLPLLRNVLLILLAVFVILQVMSQIGINIGPLLAGAGIIGLAFGFGAQSFVKDVITGFFMLVEDTIAVGDIVELAGHSGRVEAMSIRSIQLRDFQGQVHRIPFGEVTSTLNKSRGFSYAQMDIGVAYRESIDRCMEVMRDVAKEMRQHPVYGPQIIDDMEIMGVQSLADSAVVIRGRIKTLPGKQFGIYRFYLWQLKNRFDAEGIEIPYPHQTVYFGQDTKGHAPPARIRVLQENGKQSDSGAVAPLEPTVSSDTTSVPYAEEPPRVPEEIPPAPEEVSVAPDGERSGVMTEKRNP